MLEGQRHESKSTIALRLFTHLVGEREQSIRHVEPEIADPRVPARTRCASVKREAEEERVQRNFSQMLLPPTRT